MPITLFLLQFASTLFMTGLIWFVQIVHYPLFSEVGPPHLTRYAIEHARRTTWVVFPPMLAELLTTLAALYPPLRPAFVSAPLAITLSILVLILWITTGVGHVPVHTRLGQPSAVHPKADLRLLVHLNWIRTLAWTARAALLCLALLRALTRN